MDARPDRRAGPARGGPAPPGAGAHPRLPAQDHRAREGRLSDEDRQARDRPGQRSLQPRRASARACSRGGVSDVIVRLDDRHRPRRLGRELQRRRHALGRGGGPGHGALRRRPRSLAHRGDRPRRVPHRACGTTAATTGNFAFAGIDMALWDLCGKECGQPLYRLFGGPMRRQRRLFLLPRPGTPEEVPSTGRLDGVARGYGCLLPQGRRRRARRRRRCSPPCATRSGPSAKIRIDANEAWSVPEAVRLLTALARALRPRLRRGAGAGSSRSTLMRDAARSACRWRSAPTRAWAARPTCCA